MLAGGKQNRPQLRPQAGKSCYPHHVEAKFALLRLFLCKKVIRSLPCFSSFAKSHARLTCSVVNALTTVRCRYQLFASLVLTRYEHPTTSEQVLLVPIFFAKKSVACYTVPPLSRKVKGFSGALYLRYL